MDHGLRSNSLQEQRKTRMERWGYMVEDPGQPRMEKMVRYSRPLILARDRGEEARLRRQ